MAWRRTVLFAPLAGRVLTGAVRTLPAAAAPLRPFADAVREFERKASDSQPTSKVLLSQIIDGVKSSAELTQAEQVLRTLKARAFPAAMHKTCAVLLDKLLAFSSPDRALEIFADKKSFGLFPSQSTYATLIAALAKAQNYKGSLDAFHQILLDGSRTCSADALESLVMAAYLSKEKELHERAVLYVQSTETDGVRITRRTYTFLFKSFLVHEDVTGARDTLMKISSKFEKAERLIAVRQAELQLAIGNIDQSMSYLELAVQTNPGQPINDEVIAALASAVKRTDEPAVVERFNRINELCDGWKLPAVQ
eukprot:m.92759 g.92759  ORF g.92759 m.92759 type:complete len:309 (+) comp51174_c0_seq1:61-987(+)